MRTDACHNLINVFFLQERARKRTLPVATSTARSRLRARRSSARESWARALPNGSAPAGCQVIFRDINIEQVAKGMTSVARLYQDGVKRHRLTPLEARAGLDRIHPAPAEVPLRQTDLVIEAAVENLELKKKIFQRLGELAADDTLLATNTSALPVSEIAAVTRHPERVVGLHFFNPVHRMQLVEVVAARQTAPEVLQRALQFAQQIGKLPVVVKDSPGFLVNRILMPYLIEAGNLFEAGARHRPISTRPCSISGCRWGRCVCWMRSAWMCRCTSPKRSPRIFGDRMKIPACLRKMTDDGLLGRKSGRGFYLHEKSKGARPNPQASIYVQGQNARAFSREELQERMVFLMVNEAARCLEEQIVTDPADVDFAMIMGTGFAPFRGGPLRHTDAVGAAKLAGAMNYLVDSGAAHFAPCELLAGMAASGKRFYPESQ